MKLALTVATLLMASTMLTGCIDTDKPGNYPPSMMMERDSMPDNVDQKADQKTDQQTQQANTR